MATKASCGTNSTKSICEIVERKKITTKTQHLVSIKSTKIIDKFDCHYKFGLYLLKKKTKSNTFPTYYAHVMYVYLALKLFHSFFVWISISVGFSDGKGRKRHIKMERKFYSSFVFHLWFCCFSLFPFAFSLSSTT